MNIKAVKGRSSRLYFCSHIQILEHDEGISIEVCGGPPDNPEYIRLPQDADAVYIMNDRGDTIDSRSWPPKRARAGKPFLSPGR